MMRTTAQLMLLAGAAQAIPENEWTIIEPSAFVGTLPFAGKTMCGDGTPYKFSAFRGTENKLVFELEGGGVCTNKETCLDKAGQLGGTCVRNTLVDVPGTPGTGGLHAHGDAPLAAFNPVKDWNHVFLPYCNCGFHMGNTIVDFAQMGADSLPLEVPTMDAGTPGSTFAFMGSFNVRFALEWIKANYQEEFGVSAMPEKVLFTGCSAGGFGVTFNLGTLLAAIPDAEKYVLVDSAYGTIQASGQELFTNFTADDAPFTPAERDLIVGETPFSRLLEHNAATHPAAKLVTFAYEADPIIGQSANLAKQVVANQDAGLCNVVTWMASGPEHCIIPDNEFKDQKTIDGSLLADLVADLVSGECISTIANASLAGVEIPTVDCSASCGNTPDTPGDNTPGDNTPGDNSTDTPGDNTPTPSAASSVVAASVMLSLSAASAFVY